MFSSYSFILLLLSFISTLLYLISLLLFNPIRLLFPYIPLSQFPLFLLVFPPSTLDPLNHPFLASYFLIFSSFSSISLYICFFILHYRFLTSTFPSVFPVFLTHPFSVLFLLLFLLSFSHFLHFYPLLSSSFCPFSSPPSPFSSSISSSLSFSSFPLFTYSLICSSSHLFLFLLASCPYPSPFSPLFQVPPFSSFVHPSLLSHPYHLPFYSLLNLRLYPIRHSSFTITPSPSLPFNPIHFLSLSPFLPSSVTYPHAFCTIFS